MIGKITIESVDAFSSKTCSGRFFFEVIGDGEDPDLTDSEFIIDIPNKPKWIGKVSK